MTVRLLPPNPAALEHIFANLRERDRMELDATRYTSVPSELAEEYMRLREFQWVAWAEDEPVAVVGAHPTWPNVWSGYSFGTDSWPLVVLSLTKHIKRFIIPAIGNAGAHRLHALSHSGHHVAHAWMERLGFEREGVLREFGRDREDFVMLVRRF